MIPSGMLKVMNKYLIVTWSTLQFFYEPSREKKQTVYAICEQQILRSSDCLVFKAGCGIRLYRFMIIAFVSTLQPGKTQTSLLSYKDQLESWKFVLSKSTQQTTNALIEWLQSFLSSYERIVLIYITM